MYYNDELYHYGVKGMKWGVRRTQQQLGNKMRSAKMKYDEKQNAQKQKLAKISKNRWANENDKNIAMTGQKTFASRAVASVASAALTAGVEYALTGNAAKLSKQDFAKRVAKNATLMLGLTEMNIRSVANKYNSDGKLKNGKQNRDAKITKEKAMNTAIITGVKLYPYASRIAGMQYTRMKAERAANEAAFKAWGGNILEAKFADVVGANYRVLDD